MLTLLAGYGLTAFGLAPLAPDAALLPRQLIELPVATDALAPQLEALAAHRLQLSRSALTRASDSPESLLRRLGALDAAAVAWMRRDPLARQLFDGKPGKMVSATLDEHGQLLTLVARYPVADAPRHFHRLRLERNRPGSSGAVFAAQLETAELGTMVRLASGTVESSLFAATDEAGLPDPVANQMAEVFSADIDFRRELRPGDRFSVVFESLSADGEPISWNQGSGRLLAAEFVNQGRSYQAVWFDEGKGGYFDVHGQSKKREFLASPMEFSRVTSTFANRFHPIHHTWRAHLGVDYGAPIGTPVRAVGDGVVEFAGVQNGYGKVVYVQHAGERSTVYAHLSRIDVKKGQRIDAGQRIGAVGATGWATGPHLHFEFRVRDQQQDPLRMAKASEPLKLTESQKPRFHQLASQRQAQLEVAQALVGLPGHRE